MKKLYFSFIAYFLLTNLQSQSISPQVYSSGGDYVLNGNYSISYTVGEPCIQTYSAGSYILTEGFQQPNYIITIVDENDENTINIYPNPTYDLLNIKLDYNIEGYTYQLYDFNGRILLSGKINNIVDQIDFSPYPVNVYFLKIMSDNKLVQTFKIQKVK